MDFFSSILVKEHYSTALKRYFEALAAASDYFIRPVPKSMVEDLIYKRMIKCCSMLQCFTEVHLFLKFIFIKFLYRLNYDIIFIIF